MAEGCMGERERELRVQMEKLQQTNMDLTRDLNISANVHSSTIHTSQRMAAGLNWRSGDDLVHLREVIHDGESKFLSLFFLPYSIPFYTYTPYTNMYYHQKWQL